MKYTLRESERARRVRLTVRCDGTVVVTAPLGVDLSVVDRFVSEKKRWILGKLNLLNSMSGVATPVFSRDDYLNRKNEALEIIKERVGFYNEIYRFSFNRICVKNQKTRWGSCSKKGNLNFNYRIIFLPEILRDYIIVHEICHLKELNHSGKFWTLLGKVFPDYQNIRRELRKHALLCG